MDNLTHTLFAANLARLPPFTRSGRGALATLVIASNAPDADIVHAVTSGALTYLDVHRDATHGLPGMLALGIASAAAVRLAAADADLKRLVPVGIAGTVLHVLMDLVTAYGTRVLAPFSARWFALDWMPIIDVYLLLVLMAGLVAGWRWPAQRTAAAVIAMIAICGNYAIRGTMQRVAARELARPGRAVPGCDTPAFVTWSPVPERSAFRPPVCGAALPTFFSPFTWRLIRFGEDRAELQDFDVLTASRRDVAVMTHETNALMARAADGRVARVFLRFARLPVARWRVSRDGGGVADWTDLRFARPPGAPAGDTRGPFTISVRLDGRGEIVEEKIGGM